MMFFFQFIQMRNSPSIKYLCFHIICLGARGHPNAFYIYYTYIFIYIQTIEDWCICICTSPRELMGLPIITSQNNEKVESEDKINGTDEQSALFCFISIMLVLYAYHQFSHLKALRIMQVLSLFSFLAMDLKINPFILHSLFCKS